MLWWSSCGVSSISWNTLCLKRKSLISPGNTTSTWARDWISCYGVMDSIMSNQTWYVVLLGLFRTPSFLIYFPSSVSNQFYLFMYACRLRSALSIWPSHCSIVIMMLITTPTTRAILLTSLWRFLTSTVAVGIPWNAQQLSKLYVCHGKENIYLLNQIWYVCMSHSLYLYLPR